MSLGKLTTVFAPSPSCFAEDNIWKIIYTITTSISGYSDPVEQARDWNLQGPPSTTDCLPPGYVNDAESYYSPGRCPSGYTPAVEIAQTNGNGLVETTQTCCPTIRDFTYQDKRTDTKYGLLPTDVDLMCFATISKTESKVVTASNSGSTSTTMVTFKNPEVINAYGIAVRHQASDFPSSTASSAQAGDIATSATVTQNSKGLTGRQKVGLGVGLGAGLLALIILIIVSCLLSRRKRRQRRELTNRTPLKLHEPELNIPPLTEMNAIDEPGEMETKTNRPELDYGAERYELGTDTQNEKKITKPVVGEDDSIKKS